ncbi:hypothetical protein ACFV4F_08875 [Kitasatospora sp. NPDC059722]|uniref:hypothetical protein n=1 Tax=unclassified Kitasatospora TaxID=2633591 RepID=UPI0036BE3A48
MTQNDWISELRNLSELGMDIVQIAEYMRENHGEFQERSLAILNEYRIAFNLSIRQMQDIGGWYEGGISSDILRREVQLG